jgi:hypothetical protein
MRRRPMPPILNSLVEMQGSRRDNRITIEVKCMLNPSYIVQLGPKRVAAQAIIAATTDVRRKMTQRYQIEF